MKQVMVRYKVKPELAAQNEELVRRVYEELHQSAPAGVRYATFALDDGVSFVHVASFEQDNGTQSADGGRGLPRVPGAASPTAATSRRRPMTLREIGSYRVWVNRPYGALGPRRGTLPSRRPVQAPPGSRDEDPGHDDDIDCGSSAIRTRSARGRGASVAMTGAFADADAAASCESCTSTATACWARWTMPTTRSRSRSSAPGADRDRFEPRAPFRAWLYRIATNVCLTTLARRNATPPPVASIDRSRARLAGRGPTPCSFRPYPDSWLDERRPAIPGPETTVERQRASSSPSSPRSSSCRPGNAPRSCCATSSATPAPRWRRCWHQRRRRQQRPATRPRHGRSRRERPPPSRAITPRRARETERALVRPPGATPGTPSTSPRSSRS